MFLTWFACLLPGSPVSYLVPLSLTWFTCLLADSPVSYLVHLSPKRFTCLLPGSHVSYLVPLSLTWFTCLLADSPVSYLVHLSPKRFTCLLPGSPVSSSSESLNSSSQTMRLSRSLTEVRVMKSVTIANKHCFYKAPAKRKLWKEMPIVPTTKNKWDFKWYALN